VDARRGAARRPACAGRCRRRCARARAARHRSRTSAQERAADRPRGGEGFCVAAGGLQVEIQRRQMMPQAIVELARDAQPLFEQFVLDAQLLCRSQPREALRSEEGQQLEAHVRRRQDQRRLRVPMKADGDGQRRALQRHRREAGAPRDEPAQLQGHQHHQRAFEAVAHGQHRAHHPPPTCGKKPPRLLRAQREHSENATPGMLRPRREPQIERVARGSRWARPPSARPPDRRW